MGLIRRADKGIFSETVGFPNPFMNTMSRRSGHDEGANLVEDVSDDRWARASKDLAKYVGPAEWSLVHDGDPQ